MKNIIQFKTTLLQSAFMAATLFGASSCADNQSAPKQEKQEDTKKVAEEHNEAKFDTRASEKDAQFLVNAAEINMEEIKLGELAQQKSTMADTKTMGKMMVDDHTKALGELTALAKKKSVTLPAAATNKGEDAYKKLNDTKANKFDKEYADMMVSGHKDAISAFEKASTDATDADIKQWATGMLPGLRTHLDHAMMCQKKSEKMK